MFEEVLLLGLLVVEGVVLYPRAEVVPAGDGNGLKCPVSTLTHHVVGGARIHPALLATSKSAVFGGGDGPIDTGCRSGEMG